MDTALARVTRTASSIVTVPALLSAMIALRNNLRYDSFAVMADLERRLGGIRLRSGMGDGAQGAAPACFEGGGITN
jgi:hypothetical protein